MRVGRHGLPGYEKPAVVMADGSRRDLCVQLTEIDFAFLGSAWWRSLFGIDLYQLPPVDASARIAACVERPSPVILARHEGGRPTSVAGLTIGRPSGARDEIRLTTGREHRGIAGLAVVIGPRDSSSPAIAGYCLYLLIDDAGAVAGDPDGHQVPAAPSGFSLGPVLVDPSALLPSALSVSVDCPGEKSKHATVSVETGVIEQAVLAADRLIPLSPASLVLLAPSVGDRHAFPRLSPGAMVGVDGGSLGIQQRTCVAVVSENRP
jgi:hypothetical protein